MPTPDPTTSLRWGILSSANIARVAVGPAIVAADGSELVAIGSRERERAAALGAELTGGDGVRAHGSYQALLDDPEVDALYVPLPNALHEEWTVRALEAGKHVLCEKPLAPTAEACLRMAGAAQANDRLLMEAFMYRFHPRTRAAAAALRDGEIGRPRAVSASFVFRLRNPDNIRFSRELAGGALLDVGCYTVDIARALLGEEPVEASAFADWAESGVDRQLVGTLRFASGATASVTCALTLPRFEAVTVLGEGGRLELDRAFLPGTDPTDARFEGPDGATRRAFDGVDQYRLMVEAFAARVRGETPDAPLSDAHEAARTVAALEALAASARGGGRPVEVVSLSER